MMLNLCSGMADLGYPIDLVLAKAEGPHLKDVPDFVHLVDLNTPRVLFSLSRLARYLRQERPDAMLAVMNHANIVALWAQRLANVPTRIVISERNTLSVSAQHAQALRAQWMPQLVKLFYPWAHKITAVSKGVADDLAQLMHIPQEQVQVIYNPVITPELRRKAAERLDHPWFEPGQPPVILGVGRLREQKDFPTLIKAFAQVRRTCPARLMIIGEGPERSLLETLVKELNLEAEVSLPGFIDNPYPYMVQAELFVLSSRWEGLPGVLIEALYCGGPLIATDCPSGPREVLCDGRYGQLVPVGDVSAMAHAMEVALAGNSPLPTPESWQPFTLETAVSQYLDLLLER